MTLVHVEQIPVAALILQLARRPFPEWCHFKGQHIGEVPVGELMFTDGDFMVFWMTRLWETERAFDCIVRGLPENTSHYGWAQRRLQRAREHVAYYTVNVD